MSFVVPVRYRRSAWLAGLLVLIGVGGALWSVFAREGSSPAQENAVREPAPTAVVHGPESVAKLPEKGTAAAGQTHGRRVAGVVHLPGGMPAAGARVVAYRALTAWPEWRRQAIDTAITGDDGSFQFDVDERIELLLGFEHSAWAGGLEEISQRRGAVDLHLQPGFDLSGQVTNDLGSPLANVRVAIESVLADQRRATVAITAPDGRYQFTNLPAGPVRIVARHPQWQPATVASIVVGAARRVDLAFERPALSPLRGRVISAAGQTPIEGATVELLPSNGRLGLVDPLAATTDANGAFELAGIARGTVQALVRHPEHGAVVRTLAIGGFTSDLVFELPPRRSVRGQFTLNGQTLPDWAGMLVALSDTAGELGFAAVDSAGEFEFPAKFSPGLAVVSLVHAEYAFQRSNAADLQVRLDEGGREALDLPLVPATLVRGRVVDEQGKALRGVTVQQTRMLAESARWIGDAAVAFDVGAFGSQVAQLVGYERDQFLAATDADGVFVLAGQKPGPLLIRFDLPGRGGRWLRVQVASGDKPQVLEPLVMERGGRIVGRVLRGTTPLAGAAVTIIGPESQAMVVSRGDGSFVVDDLQAGEYRVRARVPSMPTASAEERVGVVVGAAPPNVRLVLPPGRTIRGVVNGTDGQPVPSALVTVGDSVGQPTTTDPLGRFTLEVPEKAIQLNVSLGDRSRRSTVSVPRAMKDIEVRLDTPSLCTIVAKVYGLPGRTRPPGALLRLASVDAGGEGEVRTRWVEMPGGELRWPLCPVGKVRVQIRCEGYAPWTAEREFLANAEQDLGEVMLESGSVLHGRVVDVAGTPVPNARILLGEEADLDLFESSVRSAADGSFAIGGVTTRSNTLIVRAPAFAARQVDLVLPKDILTTQPLVVTLDSGATIEVVVDAPAGRGHAAGLVQLRRHRRVLAIAEVDEEGRVTFPNRSPGEYTVQLYGSEADPTPVTVKSTGERVRVQL